MEASHWFATETPTTMSRIGGEPGIYSESGKQEVRKSRCVESGNQEVGKADASNLEAVKPGAQIRRITGQFVVGSSPIPVFLFS